ncbi:major facilitator superfamily domain, general substrate transporter [Trichoderma arundinaceum]|uniref:Major facilitator superfamily domain, general substrate transporter n=1 Tax=Trichoderma arundinaceum TaxID=490622 RepID=A0A395NUL8_TRIAR|nr:major facilitator superfamily domain, general substrate transporter [Trichoderma arundinaceum]
MSSKASTIIERPSSEETALDSMSLENDDKTSSAGQQNHNTDVQPVYSIYTQRQKTFIVFMSGLGGFFSPLSANTYLPSIPSLSEYLGVSPSLMNLTVTAFLIFQGLAPSFYGDLADIAGRRPAYLISFIIYITANIGLANQSSYPALFILRCLQSSGSGGTYALNSGVIADISTTAERGKYMGAAQSGIMLGPAIGPILGGVLAEYLGWRSIFWFLTICGSIYLIIFAITFPETARKVVGNGSIPPTAWWSRSLLNEFARRKAAAEKGNNTAASAPPKPCELRFPNPLKTLFIIGEKDCAVTLFYNAIIYTSWYTITANLSNLLSEIYRLDTLQIGLCYIPFGVGAALSIVANGYIQDWNYARFARTNGFSVDKKRGDDLSKFPIEKARLNIVWPLVYVGAAAIIGFGWAAEMKTHISAPLILTFVMALFLTACYNSMNLLLVDLYPNSPSTASAANNLTRCLMAAGGSAVIEPMIRAMGTGWAYTFIGLLIIAMSPTLCIVTRYGPIWREERRVRLANKASARKCSVEQKA